MVIAGMVYTMVAKMMRTWARATVRAAIKLRRTEAKQDLRRLYTAVVTKYSTGFPTAGPWPENIPEKSPISWKRPAPGFEALSFAPSTTPTHLQFHVDGWSTGFNVNAIGDLDKDGALELYRIWGDVGMFEGPIPYPVMEFSPISL